MSLRYHLSTAKRTDLTAFLEKCKFENDAFYYKWKDTTIYITEGGKSVRGIELEPHINGYTFRFTFLTHANEYLLAQNTFNKLYALVGGILMDEDYNKCALDLFSSENFIKNNTQNDFHLTKAYLKNNDYFDIFGPEREISFGSYMGNMIDSLAGTFAEQTQAFYKMLLSVQYPPIKYQGFANLLRLTTTEGKISFKQVITNSRCMVVEKVDAYAIVHDDEVVEITPDKLINILPASWCRLDERIILADVLDKHLWLKFVQKAQAI